MEWVLRIEKSTVQFLTPKYLQKVGGTFAPMGIGT